MSMDDCCRWRSAPRWGRGWSQRVPCLSNDSMALCVIGSTPSLTRKTHAFAKRDDTWDALVGLQLFDHNFRRAHRALRLSLDDGVRRSHHRSPAMALGLTDHRWSFLEVLTTRVSITP